MRPASAFLVLDGGVSSLSLKMPLAYCWVTIFHNSIRQVEDALSLSGRRSILPSEKLLGPSHGKAEAVPMRGAHYNLIEASAGFCD